MKKLSEQRQQRYKKAVDDIKSSMETCVIRKHVQMIRLLNLVLYTMVKRLYQVMRIGSEIFALITVATQNSFKR